jgi:hypothetical protein
MITLIEHSHRAVWRAVDVGNFPSAQTLTICVNLYHRHFHDWLPILEKATFSISEAPPLLLMSMSAIGAMYSRDGLQRLGVALNELVRRGVLFIVRSLLADDRIESD